MYFNSIQAIHISTIQIYYVVQPQHNGSVFDCRSRDRSCTWGMTHSIILFISPYCPRPNIPLHTVQKRCLKLHLKFNVCTVKWSIVNPTSLHPDKAGGLSEASELHQIAISIICYPLTISRFPLMDLAKGLGFLFIFIFREWGLCG